MKSNRLSLIIILWLFVCSLAVAGTDVSASFTSEEKEWIKANPVVKVGGERDWPPFDFIDDLGRYSGV
ncbi:MAG: hypothetical protein OQK25_06060, partial [Gammaproteobacteria bacterium]|nr:hypothetical protein [Gammaproteobacteria bacterium]